MEKNKPEKTATFARKKLTLDIDCLGISPKPSPRPSPRPNLPSPRPAVPSPRPVEPPPQEAQQDATKEDSDQAAWEARAVEAIVEEAKKISQESMHIQGGFEKFLEEIDDFILTLESSQENESDDHEKNRLEETIANLNFSSDNEKNDSVPKEDPECVPKEPTEKSEDKKHKKHHRKHKNSRKKSVSDQHMYQPTCQSDPTPKFVQRFTFIFEEMITKYDSSEERLKWMEVLGEDTLFLDSIGRVAKMVTTCHETKAHKKYPKMVNRVGDLHHRAMIVLEEELRALLVCTNDKNYGHSDSGGGDEKASEEEHEEGEQQQQQQQQEESNPDPDNQSMYSQDTVSFMKKIATMMIVGGYEAECSHVFMIARRKAFDYSLSKVMGYERIGIDDVHKASWEVLERDISTWIRTFKQCASVHFPRELQLMREVFAESPQTSDNIFGNLLRTIMIHLLNFAEAIVMMKRATEKLFKVLDIYEALRDSFQAIESLIPKEHEQDLKAEASTTQCRLGEAAICIFCELETSIKSETGKTPVPGGAVHPLTRYTMNYLNYACHYKDTLEQIFRDYSKIERADSTSSFPRFSNESQNNDNNNKNENDPSSPFSKQLLKVMDLLDTNLKGKSTLYKDVALSSIFMMNNGRYILQKIKNSSELSQLLGDTWSRRRSSELRNYHKTYQRETWNKLLGCLGHEGLMHHGKVQKPVLKERFKSFNAMFDDIRKTQSSWVVNDEQLQSELRVSISSLVIPAYRSFMGRFSQNFDPGRQYEKYVKFQPEDIETCIDELFDGNANAVMKKR